MRPLKPNRASTPASSPAGTPADDELMRRLAGGDLGALGQLYDRHHASVRAFLFRASPEKMDLDDLVHETFITAVQVAPRYDGRPSARPFLLGIAAQHVRRRRRAWARWAEGLALIGTKITEIVRRTPEDNAGDDEVLGRFEAALAKLTLEKRMVFLMIERDGLSGEETASALGIPVNTVWTRLHYAWSDLRRAVRRRT